MHENPVPVNIQPSKKLHENLIEKFREKSKYSIV